MLHSKLKNKRLRNRQACLWIGLLLLFIPLAAQSSDTPADNPCGPWAERVGHGGVVWTQNAVIVQGTASPGVSRNRKRSVAAIKQMAQRAATLDAYRKAAAVLSGVRITSETVAGDNVQTLSAIQAHVQRATICRAKYYADGGVDMVVKVPLSGIVTPAQLQTVGTEVATRPSPYTGLVLDATELAFAPSMAPKLLSPDGRLLFSEKTVARQVFAEGAAVRYIAGAETVPEDVVGRNPLKAHAIALGPGSPGELVVDPTAALVLLQSPAFLGLGKVVIRITDPEIPHCRDLAGRVEDFLVDWEKRLVLARGKGKVNFSREFDTPTRLRMMERAAEVNAQQNLLRAFSSVAVEGGKTAAEMPESTRNLSGLVLNARRCDAKYYRDGSAEVVLAAPLDGLRMSGMGASPSRTVSSSPPPMAAAEITGLIVDAAGLSFKPAVAPRLLDPDGDTVFSHFAVSRAYLDHYGAAAYRKSMKAARADSRAGAKPLTVRALRATDRPGELVLPESEASQVRQLGEVDGVLSRGRVIIVTN